MAEPEFPDALEAYYQKSNFFRVVHADGVYGGAGPRGNLNLAFFSERAVLPKRTRIPLVNGVPGAEHVIESKEGILREIEVNVTMDFATAVGFHAWLGKQIDDLSKHLGITAEQISKLKGENKL